MAAASSSRTNVAIYDTFFRQHQSTGAVLNLWRTRGRHPTKEAFATETSGDERASGHFRHTMHLQLETRLALCNPTQRRTTLFAFGDHSIVMRQGGSRAPFEAAIGSAIARSAALSFNLTDSSRRYVPIRQPLPMDRCRMLAANSVRPGELEKSSPGNRAKTWNA
jgi:hypothetical protein